MKLDFNKYYDKVYACWIGKNIGGTMGTPYEGGRHLNDIKGFVTEANVVLPNDDLDLQLIWLYAMEQNGPEAINSAMLGEHWISFISPHWNEYGIGKANMKRGIRPPMSGDYVNDWNNSNGAWIRTEIWACTAPGMPYVAAKNAVADASVDHGAGEGTYAAAFVCAMQSAAFVISDLRKCIEIGLSAIPERSRMAKSIRLVLKLYDEKKTWVEARNTILEANSDIGDGWFEAPSNVSYAVIGLLWGEGDFKKSMITAINCGDDTDCTGATVGATLGILNGTSTIPEDWRAHIGDSIITVSVNKGNNGKFVPKTCKELTDRVVALAPVVFYHNNTKLIFVNPFAVKNQATIAFGEEDIPEDVYDILLKYTKDQIGRLTDSLVPNSLYFENFMIEAQLVLDKAPEAIPGENIGIHLTLNNKVTFEDEPRNVNLRWILPEGFTVSGKKTAMLRGFNPHSHGEAEVDFVLTVPEKVESTNRIILEISNVGGFTPLYASFVLLG